MKALRRWVVWARCWGALDADSRDRVRGVLGEVGELAERIRSRDEQDQQTLLARRGQVSEQIGRVGKARAVHAAYGAAPVGEARYTDSQG